MNEIWKRSPGKRLRSGYLKQEEHIGEDVYVFRTDMLGDVFQWKGARESSIGEYLQGIQENRTSGQQKKGVTLREVYHQSVRMERCPGFRRYGWKVSFWKWITAVMNRWEPDC